VKLLIDECIDERLRHLFLGHDCHTAHHAGLAGMQNGLLLDAAEAAGFDVLITVDQNIPQQQNLSGRKLAILILRGPTNRLRDLVPLVPVAIAALTTIRPGEVVRIPG
jgi:predicted nuclease of predicted toxin-antitoxin system